MPVAGRAALLLGLASLMFFFLPVVSDADVRGQVELTYTSTDIKFTDNLGNVTNQTTHDFGQRYNIVLSQAIFPKLRLSSNLTFEKDISDTESTSRTKSTATTLNGNIDLALTDPLYSVGVGYTRQEQTFHDLLSATPKEVQEEYHARLAWTPYEFPPLTLQYTRTNTFDEHRLSENTTNDYVLAATRYTWRHLDLNYQITYDNISDKVNSVDTSYWLNNFRTTYSNDFFNRRVSLTTSYNFFIRTTKTSQGGKGEVSFQLFPIAGLSSVTDTPAQGALDQNPFLIDGNLTDSSGINIGLPPVVGGDTRQRNIGVDLFTDTEINELLLWVDRPLPSTPSAPIASSFSWNVYISEDNLNWKLWTAVSSAPFGSFQNNFTITFPNVRTRYIKVVTKPLTPTVPGAINFPNIFVTELQAFLQQPAGAASDSSTQSSHQYNLDVRTRILSDPSLYHELSVFLTHSKNGPISSTIYTISNGLTLNKRLSNVFSTIEHVERDDGHDTGGNRVTYLASAALTAVPLPTLRHTLVASGTRTEHGGKSSWSAAVTLSNTADLYKGISTYLSGLAATTKGETGETNRNIGLTFGSTLVPNRKLSLNVAYTFTRNFQQSGASSTSERVDLSASYHPVETVYLVAGAGLVHETGKNFNTTNFSVNWSPFSGGDLQFSIAYNESYTTDTDTKTRTFSPGMTWKVTRYANIDLSYFYMKSVTPALGTTLENAVSVSLRMDVL